MRVLFKRDLSLGTLIGRTVVEIKRQHALGQIVC
jgi:hypothetical protein